MEDVRARPGHGVIRPVLLGVLVALTAVSPDYIFVPDLTFSYQTLSNTDMVNSDLDAATKAEIKSELEPQLTYVFANITGFKSAEVTGITIDEPNKILVANWTVRLARNDPAFVNATPKEIGDIVRPQLKDAYRVYRDVIHINTSKRASTSTPDADGNNYLGVGLGLGLGLGLPVLAFFIVAAVLLVGKKTTPTQKTHEPPLSSSLGTSSRFSEGSSDLDQKHYIYTTSVNGGFIPSISGRSGPGSVSGSSGYITPDIYDTVDSTAGSVTSGVYEYVDLDDTLTDRNFSQRQ